MRDLLWEQSKKWNFFLSFTLKCHMPRKKPIPDVVQDLQPLAPTSNPLFADESVKTLDLAELETPVILTRTRQSRKRDLFDFRRQQSAREAVATLTRDNEVFGFTKGQFSMLDLLTVLVEKTGPCHLTISTWTAARKEIQELDKLVKAESLLSARWLVDYTFVRRDPEAANQIRLTFGADAMRIAKNHSKFCIFVNDVWKLVARTSMNLNMNPRFEDFTLAHDPELAGFLHGIVNEIFTKQRQGLAYDRTIGAGSLDRYFAEQM